jgi:sulfate/thiosulfate transport system substrate-binding protein
VVLDFILRRFLPGFILLGCIAVFPAVLSLQAKAAGPVLLNVSFDPTRELYRAIDEAFIADYEAKTGEVVKIRASHGGSGAQARAVIDGLPADIVTLGLAGDIDAIAARSSKISRDWQKRLPENSTPYASTIVFLVRRGNPKGIKDWDDLVRPGVKVITPNPKTSGGARWNYLAAWAYADRKFGGDESRIKAFVAALYKNAPVLDTAARGATISFAMRHLGDVLVGWESDALLVVGEFGADKFEIVTPSLSILAEPPVSLVDANVDAKGTRAIAQAYLDYLFSPKAQAIIAKHFFRPARPESAAPEDMARFAKLELLTIDRDFGGWAKAQARFFAQGALFDQIYSAR